MGKQNMFNVFLVTLQSYGGFLSASVIGRGSEEFNCGLSVAPVTDWRYYGKPEQDIVEPTLTVFRYLA